MMKLSHYLHNGILHRWNSVKKGDFTIYWQLLYGTLVLQLLRLPVKVVQNNNVGLVTHQSFVALLLICTFKELHSFIHLFKYT